MEDPTQASGRSTGVLRQQAHGEMYMGVDCRCNGSAGTGPVRDVNKSVRQ